ncbi:MAG: flagellar motor switch protein FliM [Actinomycetales bacterium]
MPTQPAAPDVARRRRRDEVTPYDFRHPTKLSREHARALQIVYETFARQWGTQLTASLRTPVAVETADIAQRGYGEWVAEIPDPTFMAMFTATPLPGTCVIQFDLLAAMGFVDRMLGGKGGSTQPQRQPSAIEVLLLRALLDRTLREFKYSVASLVDVDPELGAVETNPQFAQAAALTDVMVITDFVIRVGPVAAAVETTARIALPYESIVGRLQPAESDPSPAATAARQAVLAQARRALGESPVEVGVRLSPVRLETGDVLSLQAGDVVRIPHPTSRPLTLVVSDVPVARAVVGSAGTRLACLIVDPQEVRE